MAEKKVDREIAAKHEAVKKLEKEIRDLRDQKDKQFQKFCNDPDVMASALKATVALNELHKKGLSITDWCMGTNRVEVELEDIEEGDRNWIIIHV